MTREELQKQLQDAISTANNKNNQLGGQPVSSPVIRPATTDDLRNSLLDAVKTYQPAPVQPVQVTPVVEQPKQNIFQKAGTWVSGLFKKKEGEEQDVSKSILKPILEDKYNKLDLERKSAKPRDKKIQELTKDISEIEIAMNDASDKGMGKRILAGQKYSNERNIQQFKGAMVGLAKSTFDSIASLYEMQFKSNQDFANKQEELIRQGFKDLNIPESEQQALLEQYSPRYRKDPLRPNAPTLKETEDQIKKNIETGKEPFQKTMEKYIADVSPTNPTFADQLVQGMGSMAGFYIATILTGGGAVIPTVLESMGEAGTVYEESKKKGMPVNEAFVQSGKTFIGNLAWNAVLNKFSGLFENIGEPAIKSLKQKVLKTVNAGTWEGVQEAGQQLISNINTKKDDIWEGVLESLGLGAIIGSGAMVGEISTGKDVSPTTEVTPTTAGAEKPTEQPSGTGSGQSPEVIKDEDKEEIRTVFHGTKGENIPSILESGFRPSSEMVDFGTGVYLAGESKASDYGDLVQADIDFKKLKQYDSPLEFIEESAKFGGIDGLVEEIKKTYGGAYIKSKDTYVIYDKNLIKNIKQVVQEEIATTEAKKRGIQQPKVKKNATQGIVEPQIKKAKKTVTTTKKTLSTQKTQKVSSKSEISSKNAKSEPMTVTDHEKSIRDVYKKNEEKVYNALGEIFAEMEVAEAGQRIFVEQPDSSESKVIGISSTFPKWIPEDLRSKKLFDAVLGKIATIEDLTYPTGNRTAQRALFDEILREVDRRSGLDTVKDRDAIIGLYDKGIKQTTKTANKRLEGRKGTPKASEEKPQAKEKQVKEATKSEPKKKQVSDQDIIKYVKKRSTKFRSSGTVENLVEEAKNYSSAEEFIKAHQSQYIYHGASADLGDAPTLKRGYGYGDPGKYTGQDMGGIFFTPTLKYAMQYSQEGENSLYRYKLPKDIKIFDIRDPKHRAEFVVNSKNWEDYDSKENAKSDALRMLEDMKESSFAGAVDWATASQYIENLRQSGFDGARFLERRGDIGLREDGGFTITGDPIYSYAIFSIDEIPVERALSRQQLIDIYDKAKQYDKQDREMLTFHNIRTEGILKANKMGGIPVPSLAITKASVPFEGYGEVTLVGGEKFALDDVFTSDAYTRRVPKQQYEINRQEQSRLLKDIEPYQKLTGEEKYRGMYTALSDDANPQDLVRRANDSNVAKAMFLKEEMGVEIPEMFKEKNIAKDIANAQFGLGTRALADSEKFVKIIRSGDAKKVESVEREDKLENPEKWNRVTMFYRDIIQDAYNGALQKLSGTDYAQQVADEYRARLEETFFSNGEIIPPATYNVSYRVQEYLKDGNKEVDTEKMSERVNKAFEKVDQKAFDNWVIRRFGGIFGRSYFYDNAGRKKLYSLENIMEYMTGRVRGQENFFYGAGSIKSKISKKLFGADEVRANKDLILPDAETKEIHDAMQDELGQLIEEIKSQSEWKNTDSFGLYDQIGKDIASVGTTITPAKVKSALRKAGVSDPSTELVEKTQDYLKRLQKSPVGYFETKPQRVVKLNEFSGALVPNNIDPEIKSILEKQGLKVVEYDPKLENDRSIKAQLNFKGEMFRVKDDVKKITGRTITDEQEKQLIDLNKRIFGDDNVKITLQIMANRRALGSHREGMIQIVDGQANPKDTYYHEAVHKYIDVFTTQSEQISLFKEGMKKYGTEDLAKVEEQLAEDFIDYAKKREGVTGKIRSIFTSILNRIRKYLNSYSAIDEMYEQILTPVNQKMARKAVSKENIPVGKGDVKESALFKRTRDQLLMTDPVKYEFDDITGKYNTLNLEEDAKKAVSFLEKNPEKAIAVSLGIVDAPSGQTANGIGLATALKARDEGNYKLYTDIINSVSLRSTRMGQEIVTLRGHFNDDSAENYVKRVIDARMGKLSDDLVTAIGAVMKKTSPKKKTMERVQKETVKLKETLSKEQKKVRLAQDIIDAMRC